MGVKSAPVGMVIIGVLVCSARVALADEPAPTASPEAGAVPPPPASASAAAPWSAGQTSPAAPTMYASPAPAPPPERPDWRPRHAHVAISLEQVLAFETLGVETTHDEPGDGSALDETHTRTTFPLGLQGGRARLAVDGLFGGTVGAFASYFRDASRGSSEDPVLGRTEYPERSLVSSLLGVRGGAIIGGGRLALWLRGGVGYAWTSVTPSESATTTRTVLVAFDPVLIMSPARHVALTVGPVLEGAYGSATSRTKGVIDPGAHTWLDVYLRFVAGLSLMF